MAIDPNNCGSQEALHSVRRDPPEMTPFKPQTFGRKSLVPDPEFVVRIPELLAQLSLEKLLVLYPVIKIGKATVDKADEPISDDFAAEVERLYRFLNRPQSPSCNRAAPSPAGDVRLRLP